MSAQHTHGGTTQSGVPDGAPQQTSANSAPGGAPTRPVTPAWRLVSTLMMAGAMAGLLIVTVFQWAEPRILSHQARAMAAAVGEVLQAPARTETLYLHDGRLLAAAPPGVDTMKLEKIWAGYDRDGRRIGYAMVAAEPGFQDVIRLMFGYDAATRRVLGMRVLESRETPGLGDRIEKDSSFVGAFVGALSPLQPVKPGAGTGDEREIDTITGATISSRAVINIINRRLEQVSPLLETYERAGGGS